jgi:glucose/arabinose dehydrogenase
MITRDSLIAIVLAVTSGVASDAVWSAESLEVENSLTAAERRAGWRLLFDGSSADAFRRYRGDAIGDGWVIRDGALVRVAAGAGDIITREQFGAFELQLEYRISPGGNSGLMFHVTEDEDRPWKTGPEVQILDNAAGADPQKAGWLYQLVVPRRVRQVAASAGREADEVLDATRPAGEWNQLYLRVAPTGSEVCLNGQHYYFFRKGSAEWDRAVAASKFAAFSGFGKPETGHICLQDHGDEVAFRGIKIRELPADGRIAFEDGTLAVEAVPAFPAVSWEGVEFERADGRPAPPTRPLVLTHAGDGSGRRFVLDQVGTIHVFAAGSDEGRLFLDLRPDTTGWWKSNEEGLFGLAFHPRFAETGEFFVTYTLPADEGKLRERVSRFRVQADDPDRADRGSEQVLLTIDQPFLNHNGGSIVFGLDGYLYIGFGDGGSRDDPLHSSQDLGTWLGKVLRIDVDHPEESLAYGIPADNPFIGAAEAKPEIFAFGFRNPWQLSCDSATGRIWAGDVGQDLWEEINVIEKGRNYGWSLREGTKPFGRSVSEAVTVAPVWEYDHQIGKSVTGGLVYRGSEIPELVGSYLYGDHVSGRLWALRFDDATGTATNMAIPWSGLPIFGFGADEAGEAYVLTNSPTGQGVFRLAPRPQSAAR